MILRCLCRHLYFLIARTGLRCYYSPDRARSPFSSLNCGRDFQRRSESMVSSEQHPHGGTIPDFRAWGLHEGLLTEPIPGTSQVALWLPAGHEGGYQCWERVAPLEPTGFAAAPGV